MKSGYSNARRSLPIIVAVLVLGGVPLVLKLLLGNGSQLIASLVAVAAWLLARPWRLCAISTQERHHASIYGTVGLCALSALYAFNYMAHQR